MPIDAPVVANDRTYPATKTCAIVICLDGCEPEYLDVAIAEGLMPTLKRIRETGTDRLAHSVIPSFTNPNNMSIATGRPPAVPRTPDAAAALAALACLFATAAPALAAPEPAVQRQVLEDDKVRIEELRVRGVNQRLVVRPKIEGVAEYEIVPDTPAQDASQDRRGAGQRVWRLFSF